MKFDVRNSVHRAEALAVYAIACGDDNANVRDVRERLERIGCMTAEDAFDAMRQAVSFQEAEGCNCDRR